MTTVTQPSGLKNMLRAAADGNLALVECRDALTGETRYVICAAGTEGTESCSRPLAISPMATPLTPICRRPEPCRTDPPADLYSTRPHGLSLA